MVYSKSIENGEIVHHNILEPKLDFHIVLSNQPTESLPQSPVVFIED